MLKPAPTDKPSVEIICGQLNTIGAAADGNKFVVKQLDNGSYVACIAGDFSGRITDAVRYWFYDKDKDTIKAELGRTANGNAVILSQVNTERLAILANNEPGRIKEIKEAAKLLDQICNLGNKSVWKSGWDLSLDTSAPVTDAIRQTLENAKNQGAIEAFYEFRGHFTIRNYDLKKLKVMANASQTVTGHEQTLHLVANLNQLTEKQKAFL